MKKLLLGLSLFCVTFVCGQNRTTVDHFKFLGIPLNGTIENFDKQLKNKGFENIFDDAYVGMFDGDSVLVFPCVSDEINNVYGVMITVAEFDTHSEAIELIDRLKSRYEYKYNGVFENQGSFESLTVLKKEKPFGIIFISTKKVGEKHNVVVSYFDAVNWQKDLELTNKDL